MKLTQIDHNLQDIIIQKVHNCLLEEAREKEIELIGLPPTLDRVLYALQQYDIQECDGEYDFGYNGGGISYMGCYSDGEDCPMSIERKLQKIGVKVDDINLQNYK